MMMFTIFILTFLCAQNQILQTIGLMFQIIYKYETRSNQKTNAAKSTYSLQPQYMLSHGNSVCTVCGSRNRCVDIVTSQLTRLQLLCRLQLVWALQSVTVWLLDRSVGNYMDRPIHRGNLQENQRQVNRSVMISSHYIFFRLPPTRLRVGFTIADIYIFNLFINLFNVSFPLHLHVYTKCTDYVMLIFKQIY